MKINIIVAMDIKNGIGKTGNIPWNIKEDMKHFKKTTIGNKNNAIIMGRKTMESIPNYLLPDRFNIIISKRFNENMITKLIKNKKKNENKEIKECIENNYSICGDIHNALNICYKHNFEEVWIIGGGEIYSQFLENEIYREHIYKCIITKIYNNYECDTFFPNLLYKWKKAKECKLNDNIYIEEWINELYKFNI